MENNIPGPFPDPAAGAIDRHVGQQLRRQRKRHGLSISTVAQALTVSESSLDQWERGQFRIPARHLLALSRLLSCPLTTFFEGLPASLMDSDSEPVDGDLSSFISRQFDAKH